MYARSWLQKLKGTWRSGSTSWVWIPSWIATVLRLLTLSHSRMAARTRWVRLGSSNMVSFAVLFVLRSVVLFCMQVLLFVRDLNLMVTTAAFSCCSIQCVDRFSHSLCFVRIRKCFLILLSKVVVVFLLSCSCIQSVWLLCQ